MGVEEQQMQTWLSGWLAKIICKKEPVYSADIGDRQDEGIVGKFFKSQNDWLNTSGITWITFSGQHSYVVTSALLIF